jgi:hypothetical protein
MIYQYKTNWLINDIYIFLIFIILFTLINLQKKSEKYHSFIKNFTILSDAERFAFGFLIF